MGVKRCRKVRPFLPRCYTCMEMHATHYLIYILYDMTSNTVAKVAHSFEMSKYEGRKEKKRRKGIVCRQPIGEQSLFSQSSSSLYVGLHQFDGAFHFDVLCGGGEENRVAGLHFHDVALVIGNRPFTVCADKDNETVEL